LTGDGGGLAINSANSPDAVIIAVRYVQQRLVARESHAVRIAEAGRAAVAIRVTLVPTGQYREGVICRIHIQQAVIVSICHEETVSTRGYNEGHWAEKRRIKEILRPDHVEESATGFFHKDTHARSAVQAALQNVHWPVRFRHDSLDDSVVASVCNV
jgi:hypothetical protein